MDEPLFKLMFSVKQKCIATEEKVRKEMDLSHSEFHGLLSLTSENAIPGHQFAEFMGLSASRASRVVKRLLERDFIQTQFSPKDRRSQLIQLTEKGKRERILIETRLQRCEQRVMEKYSDEDVLQIKWALQLLDEAL